MVSMSFCGKYIYSYSFLLQPLLIQITELRVQISIITEGTYWLGVSFHVEATCVSLFLWNEQE